MYKYIGLWGDCFILVFLLLINVELSGMNGPIIDITITTKDYKQFSIPYKLAIMGIHGTPCQERIHHSKAIACTAAAAAAAR